MVDQHPYQEPPLKFFGQVADLVAEGVSEHEQRMHRSNALEGPEVLPWEGCHVGDALCARAIELLEGNEVTVDEVALHLGVPPTLLQRELALFRARYNQYCQNLATFGMRIGQN